MIHIVFNEADAKVLQAAIELDETINGSVITIKDDYAVGPLDNIYQEEGMNARHQWWESVYTGGDFSNAEIPTLEDHKAVAELATVMSNDENEVIWIWAAQNNHDVCGYFWLLSQVRDFSGRVMILYLNNLPFINEKGNIFYPTRLSEIPSREFLKAKKLARPITTSEFEVDTDEWSKIMAENKGVRLLEGGKKLSQQDYSHFDTDIKRFVMPDWQKAGKVIGNFLSKAKHTTGEAFLLWRLKVLVAMEQFDVQGKVANMKDFEIKYRTKTEQ